MSVPFAALSDQVVNTVDELTNAIVCANAGSRSANIVLNPGTYDLSGLSSNIFTVGSKNNKCGTSCSIDDNGPASLVTTVALNLRGANATHWSQKTHEQESILKGSGAMRILYGYSGTGRKSTYQHLTFEDGAAGTLNGGAIYAASCAYTPVHGCSNCVFRGCSAKLGGATYCVSATDCLYEGNRATSQGGAAAGSLTSGDGARTNEFIACVFRGNYSSNNAGALYYNAALDTLRDCVFEANTSKWHYASLYVKSYKLVTGCTFKDNVTVSGSYAGVAVTNVAYGGMIENCLFDNNHATNLLTNVGSQIRYAKQVTDCTFRGYGDMYAVAYDRCTFGGCSFNYYDSHGGMVVFDTKTGGGHLRNCLFTNNTVTIVVDNDSGAQAEIANCTFVGNEVIPNEAGGGGYLFYAFRGGKDPNDATKYLPSTNHIVNCVFKNNTRGGVRSDVSSYRTVTKVSTKALCILQNSIYEVIDNACNDKLEKIDCIKADPKLVDGDPRYPEEPACMIRRNSKARRAGLVLDWMAGAVDYQGLPMLSSDNKVDMGCYQCNLNPCGWFLEVR